MAATDAVSVAFLCRFFPDGEHRAAENGNAAFALWQPTAASKSAGSDFWQYEFLRNHDDEDENRYGGTECDAVLQYSGDG